MHHRKSLLLKDGEKLSTQTKAYIALVAAIVFFIIASPALYGITTALTSALGLGATANGAATVGGLLLHTLVVFLVVWGLLYFFA